ncbi:hypothetical protein HK101_012041, partial [Irineochytrium annulatum]
MQAPAIWSTRHDLEHKSVMDFITAHTSFCYPMHHHQGTITLTDNAIVLSGHHKSQPPEQLENLTIAKSSIQSVEVGFDDHYGRFRDGRGGCPPLIVHYGDDAVYIDVNVSRLTRSTENDKWCDLIKNLVGGLPRLAALVALALITTAAATAQSDGFITPTNSPQSACKTAGYICQTECSPNFILCSGSGSGLVISNLVQAGATGLCRNGSIAPASLCPAVAAAAPTAPVVVTGNVNVAVAPSAAAKASATSGTAYGAQGLTSCQYTIALKITSVFETSSTNLDFGICEDAGDGQGYSAGFIQFTTSSGSALKVVLAYLQTTPTSPLASFVPALQSAAAVGNGGLSTGQGDTVGLTTFCTAWSAAASDPNFTAAQLAVQSELYMSPNAPVVASLGLKTALGVSLIFDMGVQLGFVGMQTVVSGVVGAKTPAQGGDEKAYITALLNSRLAYINKLGGAYPATAYRCRAFDHILGTGNVDYTGGSVQSLDNAGNPITIT